MTALTARRSKMSIAADYREQGFAQPILDCDPLAVFIAIATRVAVRPTFFLYLRTRGRARIPQSA
jgi:hypothetical protein